MVSAFSMPKAKRQQKVPSHPGPGAYNAQSLLATVTRKDPQYSFGNDSRLKFEASNPGPGSYNPHQRLIEPKTPKYTMRARQKDAKEKYNIGPGHYHPSIERFQPQSPSFSILGRKNEKKTLTPGPGQYKSRSFIEKEAGYQFGKELKLRNSEFKTPAPGDYDSGQLSLKYKSKEEPKYHFGQKFQQKTENFPGPGQYSPKRQVFSKIGGVCTKDFKPSLVDKRTPGPGAYNTRVPTQDTPKWSLPKQKRMELSKNYSLGPGHYNEFKSYKGLIQKAPAFGFGASEKLKLNQSSSPGPGAYNNTLQFSRKSVRIGEKYPINYDNKLPGPGSYESIKYDQVNWLRGKNKYTLGRSPKFNEQKQKIPGPGTYRTASTLERLTPKANFSKEERMKMQKKVTPGPGNYNIKPTFADVPSYLLP